MISPNNSKLLAWRLCSVLRTRGHILALLAEFAHDLRDINGGTGSHPGPLFLLLLPEDNGAETGPSVLRVLLQLGVARRPEILIH